MISIGKNLCCCIHICTTWKKFLNDIYMTLPLYKKNSLLLENSGAFFTLRLNVTHLIHWHCLYLYQLTNEGIPRPSRDCLLVQLVKNLNFHQTKKIKGQINQWAHQSQALIYELRYDLDYIISCLYVNKFFSLVLLK